jgi:methyltransferase-like protein
MFLTSSAKPIDDNLKNMADEIEAQSPGLSVLAARQFRYSLRQTHVEVTIKEPRQFNVLEEFIIRAGVELGLSANSR